jgi:ribosome-associated translation inhibitor RaiA
MATKKQPVRAAPITTEVESASEQGRRLPAHVPFVLRGLGMRIDGTFREYVQKRVGFKLARFGVALDRVAIRLERVSGERGAPAYVCRFAVDVPSAGKVTVEASDPSVRAAFDAAADAAERALRRLVESRAERKTSGRRRP